MANSSGSVPLDSYAPKNGANRQFFGKRFRFIRVKETLMDPLPDETAGSHPNQEKASPGPLHPKQALFSAS